MKFTNFFRMICFNVAFLCTFLISLNSCKEPNKVCSTCTLLPYEGKINFKVNENNFELKYWDDTLNNDRYYRTGIGDASSTQVENIINWVKLPMKSKPVSVVLYSNKFISNNEQLNLEEIIGCQYYFVVDNILVHEFYYMDKGKLVNVRSLTGQASGINYNNRFDLYRLYFASAFSKVFAFELTDVNVIYHEPKFNEVNGLIKYMLQHENKYSNAKITLPPGGITCEKPCANKNATRACERKGAQPASCDDKHDDTDDPSVSSSSQSVSMGILTQQDADITFNLPLQYLFRDSFMNKYNYGRKYIDYYYGLTSSSYISSSIIQQTIIVLNLFNSRMNWLLSPNIYGNQILIDNNFKNEVSTLLDMMIVAAPNNTEKNYLIEAKNDLTTYQNLTVNQFLGQIN